MNAPLSSTERTLPNVGHGHVFPRPDGMKARCGGPALCSECAQDLALKERETADTEKELERLKVGIEEICQHRGTPPITRARLRYLVAGVDWRKAK